MLHFINTCDITVLFTACLHVTIKQTRSLSTRQTSNSKLLSICRIYLCYISFILVVLLYCLLLVYMLPLNKQDPSLLDKQVTASYSLHICRIYLCYISSILVILLYCLLFVFCLHITIKQTRSLSTRQTSNGKLRSICRVC